LFLLKNYKCHIIEYPRRTKSSVKKILIFINFKTSIILSIKKKLFEILKRLELCQDDELQFLKVFY
jgi:hypothetical protein